MVQPRPSLQTGSPHRIRTGKQLIYLGLNIYHLLNRIYKVNLFLVISILLKSSPNLQSRDTMDLSYGL